jgi:DNA-binding transcriptional LysR family regulator
MARNWSQQEKLSHPFPTSISVHPINSTNFPEEPGILETEAEQKEAAASADRLRISQSAITRQMRSLELDLGGRILERTSAGARPADGGHALAERAKTLLEDYDSTMAEFRRLVRGASER